MQENNISIQNISFSDDYIRDIKEIITRSRAIAYQNVNSILVQSYWLVGYRIVVQEQKGEKRAEYGSKLIEKLSRELNSLYGGGMSEAQLWNCRQFYSIFPDKEILYTLCRELNWSKIRVIMRISDNEERNYYINEAKNGNWSVRELERNIKTDMYHRLLKNQYPENKISTSNRNESMVKDPYILEFLGIGEQYKLQEKKLENAIITNMQKFLLELGRGFCFVDRQMHISTEMSDFYIDLVFYNYIIKCFVLIDLKTTKLTHQDIGQMDMYVRMFDNLKKQPDDNPTIGLILCAEKDEIVAKYSVLNESKQIFASKYITVLPTEKEIVDEIDRNKRFLLGKIEEIHQ